MTIEAMNYRPYSDGKSLIGFVDVAYHGIVIRGCKVCRNESGGLWIGYPQRSYDKNGEIHWADHVTVFDPERERLRRGVLTDLRRQGITFGAGRPPHVEEPSAASGPGPQAQPGQRAQSESYRTSPEGLQDDIPF